MRRALIGILMAATAATPLAAQDNGWHGRDRGHEQQQQQQQQQRPQQRPQRQQQAQPRAVQQQAQPQRFQQAPQMQRFEGRGAWAGRGFQQQAPAQAQVQPQEQSRQRWQGRGDAGWGGQSRFNGQRNVADPRGQRFEQQQQVRGDWRQGRSNDGRWNGNGNWRGARNEGVRWNRDWRNDSRYDWQRYRYSNRRAFHLGPYYAPYRNYYYNPLEIGIVLDALFYDRDYWIDPAYYDLPPAPPGAEWVRYYNDVVLVDMESGEVLDVIRGFFF